MKIKSLLVGMLACTAMVSCTNEEVLENNEVIKAGEKGYVAVNVFAQGGSRAADSFEAGIASESAVSKAVFLFLDGNYNGCANPYEVTNFEWSTEGVRDDQTKKATTLVIDGIKGEVPAYIVAILNPTQDMTFDAETDLDDLKNIVANYSSISTNMVMSNAVYAAGNNKEVVATPIALENIVNSKEALNAEDYKPVTIQVERVVAKVAVDKLAEAITALNTSLAGEEADKIDDQEDMKLEFVLTGWEVLQNNQSRLIKNIDATNWTITGWNSTTLMRSYWANDYAGANRTSYLVNELSGKDDDFKYVEETVNQTAHAALDLTNGNDGTTPYLIVSGKFVKKGTTEGVNLVEWRGQKYTAEGYLNLVAGMANVSQYYYIAGEENGETLYESLSASHLELVDTPENDWGATAELKKDAPTFYTVTFAADGKTVVAKEEAPVATVKAAIAEFGEVKYWNGGNTYYFVPIRHQELTAATETTPAVNYYGVVRNHVYKMNISKINGYGTPVSDPDQAIDKPENPEEGDTYMAAEVVILDWKVVNNKVELN